MDVALKFKFHGTNHQGPQRRNNTGSGEACARSLRRNDCARFAETWRPLQLLRAHAVGLPPESNSPASILGHSTSPPRSVSPQCVATRVSPPSFILIVISRRRGKEETSNNE